MGHCKIVLATLGILLTASVTGGEEKAQQGWSASRPESGRYVKTDRGYMVPYTLEIPGTEAKFSMEPIPGGEFLLGSPPDAPGHKPDEGPQIKVRLQPFWIGRYEVTWAEYKEFMNLYSVFKDFETRGMRAVDESNKVDAVTAPTELYDPSFTFEFGEEPEQPAVTMTQYAAKQYTKWVSAVTGHRYRLPSEAEWEYACRAGTTTAYSFGNDADKLGEYAWYFENSDEQLHAVGTKKPNPWGLYDMHGNVWEWVLDAYSDEGYRWLADKQPVTGAEAINWPTELFPRVVRGGSWDEDPAACRSAARLGSHDIDWKSEDPNLPLSPWWFTSDPARGVGFRLVRPADEPTKEAMAKYWDADVEDIHFSVTARLEEGRGALGLVDRELPDAIKKMQEPSGR